MIKQRYSTSTKNPNLISIERNTCESDITWLERAYTDFSNEKEDPQSYIMLLGSKDIAAFRIRVAQSYLRADRLPSYWSDCGFLLINHDDFKNSTFFYLPLLQPSTAQYAPIRNGLISLKLHEFLNCNDFPNIALLAIPVAQDDINHVLQTFQKSHIAYDAVENIIPWLTYVWGIGNAANPLMQQIGFPSAMLLNQLYGSCNFDLSPSVNNNLSSPEVFWNGVMHWTDFYSNTMESSRTPKGRYVIGHNYEIIETSATSSPTEKSTKSSTLSTLLTTIIAFSYSLFSENTAKTK